MHLLGIAAATTLIVFCALRPFLPGSYDVLAVPLSAMAQTVGTAGLLLVPVGGLTLVAERSPRLVHWRFLAALLLLVVTALVLALIGVVALIHSGFTLGVVVLAAAAPIVRRMWMTLARRGGTAADSTHVISLYLTIVPLASALLQLVLVGRAVEFSRQRAHTGSASGSTEEFDSCRRDHSADGGSIVATSWERLARHSRAKEGRAEDSTKRGAERRRAT